MVKTRWRVTDLFAGCGGLTHGLKRAGFNVVSAVEIDELAASTYKRNHPEVNLIHGDIRDLDAQQLLPEGSSTVDLVAGCGTLAGARRNL
jgi:DNA (cytosine-5)-methyltransferase 1